MNRDLVEKLFKRALILSVPIIILLVVIFKDKSYILGYIFGLLISMLNFLLLKSSIEKSVRMDVSGAEKYARSQYFIRMLIIGIVLIIGAKADYLNFFTVFLGILIIKITIVISTIIGRKL